MAQDEDNRGPDDQPEASSEVPPEQPVEAAADGAGQTPAPEAEAAAAVPASEPAPEAEATAEAAAEVVPAPAPAPVPVQPPPRPVSVRPPARPAPRPELQDDGLPEPGQRRPSRFGRRAKLVFVIGAVVLLIGGGIAGFLILFEQHQAKICADARRTDDPGKLRACWNSSTQKQWRPAVLHHIAERDQAENLDLVIGAVEGNNFTLAREAANTLLYMVQSPEQSVRDKVASYKDSVIKKRMAALAGSKSREAREVRALLGLTLLYLSDVDGLDAAIRDGTEFNYEAFSDSLVAYLANKDPAFFEGVMKETQDADPPLMTRVLGVLEKIDYSARDTASQARRDRVITLLKQTLAGHPDPDVEVAAILCWAETGDEGALQRVAEYFDRAAVLENADVVTEKAEGADLARRAEQLFNKVKLRYGAEKLVDLYRLIKKNHHRQEKILYLVRQLHDPREKVRQFLLEQVEKFAPPPPDHDFGLWLDDEGNLTHPGTLYVNAVFALAELLDANAIPHLKTILNKFSTMVKITDEQANLLNAGLLILGSIAVREGPPVEEDVARYIFELSDPRKYPERWTEKRAGKLHVLSFIAADLWSRFLAAHPECRTDIDATTTLVKKMDGCVSAVDLQSELAPPPGTPAAAVPAAVTPPTQQMTDLEKELAKRADRLREFEEGDKTLDQTKQEELTWVFDTAQVDLKAKIYYFTKVFACPIEITMDSAMMDRNDPRVKEYERWCGDYAPATESLARLAHSASDSFQREARQFLTQRLDKGFLKYPGTQEPIQYDQYMNKEIFTFVSFREAVAKSLGYLGTADPKLIEALRTVAFDETDHPKVGLPAGESLGIVADAATLDEIVDGFVSEDTHPDIRGYLLKALQGHFRFAPLDDLAPKIPEADARAIDKLVQFLATYQGGLGNIFPLSRMYLLGTLFGSLADNATIAGKLVELAKGSDARIREVAFLALICGADREAAMPLFEEIYGDKPPEANVQSLRSETTLRTLRDVYMNVGSGADPYTIPVRSGIEINDETLFHRLDVLHALASLDQKEFLDYYTMRLTLALGVDKDAYDKAVQEAGLEAAEQYTPIAYKLAYKDNFTYFETPYLTWIDGLYKYAADSSKKLQFREYAMELLWRIDERGYVYAIYADTGMDGRPADDRALHDYVYGTVMRDYQ